MITTLTIITLAIAILAFIIFIIIALKEGAYSLCITPVIGVIFLVIALVFNIKYGYNKPDTGSEQAIVETKDYN